MRYFFAFLILVIWAIMTIALTISIVGLFVITEYGDEWFGFAEKLLNVFNDKKD